VGDLFIKLGPWAIGLIFTAGILYAGMVAGKRNLNGVGIKVRGIQEANEQRYLTVVVVTMLQGVKDEEFDRYARYAEFFLAAGRGRNL
jgi:hypothetical protein